MSSGLDLNVLGRRYLGFLHYVNFDGKPVCGTSFSTSVSNSVVGANACNSGQVMAKNVIFNMAAVLGRLLLSVNEAISCVVCRQFCSRWMMTYWSW